MHRCLKLFPLLILYGMFIGMPNAYSQQSGENELTEDVLMRSSLFPEPLFSLPVYAFIDRYLNQLASLPSQSSRLNLLQEDMLSLKWNGVEAKNSNLSIDLILKLITPFTTFALNENEKSFDALWYVNEGADIIEFSFPKQYDLILGKDKKELTRLFGTDLKAYHYEYKPNPLSALFDDDSFAESYQIIADLGDSYIIPQMRSGQYIQKKEGHYDFVLSERMGQESLLNLFTHADRMNRANQLELIIKGYNSSDTISYRLDHLCAYMKAHSCKAYLGLESENEEEYTGTVFYVNKELMYKHLFFFHFPKSALQREQDIVTIKVYPYIPINNIGDLYEDITSEMNL